MTTTLRSSLRLALVLAPIAASTLVACAPEGASDLMDDARGIARELARLGDVEITQRGEVLDPDAIWRGPIRIRAR